MRKDGAQTSSLQPALNQQQQPRKLAVVYYLCRNRHLEHPHFIEVPLSSPEGLYLRDVISRLNVLRGKGMPAMYSWSCKRSYKNGFVWHDLSNDDLILPTNGNEFVLKGSELLDKTPFDKTHHSISIGKLQISKVSQSETPSSSRTNETSSSSTPTVCKESNNPSPPSPPPSPLPLPQRHEEEHCLLTHRLCSPSNASSKNVSSFAEYRVCKPNSAANASTQTDDGGRKIHVGRKNSCSRGVSTDETTMDFEYELSQTNLEEGMKDGSKLCRNEISPPLTSSSASSSGGKMETLESLIRADVGKINSFRILEEEKIPIPTGPRLKATNVLMQLITCGSISVKDHHSFGIVPTYKPKFSHTEFPSPMFANSMMFGDRDYLSDNMRFIGLRMEDKEYFSGSLLETNKYKEHLSEGSPTLKRSSSFNADRREKETFVNSSSLKCLSRPVNITLNKPSRDEMMRSQILHCPRNSSAGPDSGLPSINGSKRITDTSLVKGSSMRLDSDTSLVKGSSMRLDSSIKDKEKMMKIEERLISGARVIIQSRVPYDDREDSSTF